MSTRPDYLAQIQGLRGLHHKPDKESLRLDLAQQADAISAAISEAALRPSAERCEQLAIRLEGVRRLALSYRTALIVEGDSNADVA